MRVLVDRTACEANGVCVTAAPEVFELPEDDDLIILDESPPEDLRAKVEAAVRTCPKQALQLLD